MQPTQRDLGLAVFAGCMISFIGFGLYGASGVFLAPISESLGWGREVFSLSMAVQVLFWGIAQPLAGVVADRRGATAVLVGGVALAVAGYLIRAYAADPTVFILSGVPLGLGTSAASFQIIVIALSKVLPENRRSLTMGLGTAFASFGMFCGAPLVVWLIGAFGWRETMMMMAAAQLAGLLFILPVARVSVATAAGQGFAGFSGAVRDAFGDRSYVCLFLGFFVCGFHVSFIQTHLPSYIADLGLAASAGAWALGLIGLFNIAGSIGSGWLGQNASMRLSLSAIYFLRAIVIAVFVMAPATEMNVYLFSAAMGLLWLSTVPLTMGLVARTQGLTFLSTLTGLVFLSHQVGGFLGAWLGGRIYDTTQSYEMVWWIGAALGLFATLVHLPIRDRPAAQIA